VVGDLSTAAAATVQGTGAQKSGDSTDRATPDGSKPQPPLLPTDPPTLRVGNSTVKHYCSQLRTRSGEREWERWKRGRG